MTKRGVNGYSGTDSTLVRHHGVGMAIINRIVPLMDHRSAAASLGSAREGRRPSKLRGRHRVVLMQAEIRVAGPRWPPDVFKYANLNIRTAVHMRRSVDMYACTQHQTEYNNEKPALHGFVHKL